MTGLTKALLGVFGVAVVAGLAILLTMEDGPGAGGDLAATRPVAASEDDPGRAMQLPETGPGETRALQSVDTSLPSAAAGSTTAAASEADEAAADGPKTTLVGRVVDTAGRPIPEALVVYHADNGAVFISRGAGSHGSHLPDRPEGPTDRNGEFRIEVPTPGVPAPEDDDEDATRWVGMGQTPPRVVVAHAAFATGVQDCPDLQEGEVDLGTLTLEPGAQVAGRVVDEMGRPLSGATVSARNEDDHGGGMPLMHLFANTMKEVHSRATTGSDGRFVIGGLEPGKASVTARAEDRQPGFVSDVVVEIAAPTNVGDISLAAGQTIAGYVVDDDGQPVADARVSVSSMTRLVISHMEDLPRQRMGHEMGLTALTNAEGWFELNGLGAGPYTLHASRDGYSAGSQENVAPGTLDARVSLTRLGGLLVTIRSMDDNQPVADAEIEASALREGFSFGGPGGEGLEILSGEEALAAAGVTDLAPEGRYFIVGAGPTGTELGVTAPGFAHTSADGPAVSAGRIDRVEVLLPKESIVEGYVVDGDGQPVADAQVRLDAHEPADFLDELGSGGMRREVRRSISVGGESPSGSWSRTRTRDDGFFRISSVPAGDWEVIANADGFSRSDAVVVTLALGQSQRDLKILLEASGTITGLVRTHAGEPVPGAEVKVAPVSNEPVDEDDLASRLSLVLGGDSDSAGAPRRATADRDGRFEVSGLRPGAYDVTLSKSGGTRIGGAFVFMAAGGGEAVEDPEASQRVQVVAREESHVELVRPPFAKVEGRVMAAGRPAPGVSVTLGEQNAFLPMGGDVAETDDYGRFTFEKVEPGAYELSCVVPGAAIERKLPLEVAAGQTETADILFDGATLSGRVVDRETGVGVPDVTINVTPVAQVQQNVSFQVVTVDASGSGGGGGMSMQFGGGSQSKVRSGPDGYFEARFLEAGEYVVETTGGGYLEAEAGPIDVLDGRELDDLLVEVERGATVSGLVRSGASGQALDGVPVQLSGGGGPQMTTTSNGRYSFQGLGAGEYTVSVLGSGFQSEPLARDVVSVDRGEVRTLDLTTKG